MWEHKILEKNVIEYLKNLTYEQLLNDLKECDRLHLLEEKSENNPYVDGIIIKTIRKYNPNYGDYRVCECGHDYYRHFDSYESNYPCGCKYCECRTFKEKLNES